MEKSDPYDDMSKADADVARVENIEDNTMVVVNDADISYGKNGIPGLIGSPYVFGAALLWLRPRSYLYHQCYATVPRRVP